MKEPEMSDEEHYNLMVEAYSDMENEPTFDQELDDYMKALFKDFNKRIQRAMFCGFIIGVIATAGGFIFYLQG